MSLPPTAVQAFHRADDSTTTRAFTRFLSSAEPQKWPYQADTIFPGRSGLSASGTSGVKTQISRTVGSIGYLDLAGAGDLDTVRLKTKAAAPVTADTAATTKALASSRASGSGGELAVAIDPATGADGAYPIALVSYGVVCDKGNDPATLASLRAFLSYATSRTGQLALSAQGQAPLPDALAVRVRNTARALT